MKIMITGPQGSGKTTQAEQLSKILGLPVVETGGMLRQLENEESDRGRAIKQALESGVLVDNEIVAGVVKDRIVQGDCEKGFIMDGYPRELAQLEFFDPHFDQVFYLNLPEEMVVERMLKRGREDDTPEFIKKRLEVYHQRTIPVLDYYQSLGILQRIDASGDIETVQAKIRERLNHGA